MGYYNERLADRYSVSNVEKLVFENEKCITVSYGKTAKSNATSGQGISNDNVTLKLFGVFPIKQASVETVNDSFVYVMGKPFGIKLYTDGVLVVGINDVKTEGGTKKPAEDAGLKIGDSIISIGGQKVETNEQLANIISASNGQAIKLKIQRDGKNMTIYLKPVFSSESATYKAGIWVRDSSAGIGTLTFYSPSAKIIGGLGHGICDSDTDTLLNISGGELVDAEIISCNRSEIGKPGELVGSFKNSSIAPLLINSNAGVFGVSNTVETDGCSLMKMATKQETKNGKAQILSTVNSGEPKLYDCTIKILSTSEKELTQNIYVTITDDELIKETGGIVQGMSGSPIIQDGTRVGAVTHVLVDNPENGYGIFAENMLNVAKEQTSNLLSKAS